MVKLEMLLLDIVHILFLTIVLTACGCGSDYKVCDSVTGHCVCPPNIVGRKCDSCMVNHWNWTAAHGCEVSAYLP